VSAEAGAQRRPTAAAGATSLGGRFERGLRRTVREQTSMLSWLAESDETEALRTWRRPVEIDLRDQPVIDVRDPEPEVVIEPAEKVSLFSR